MTTPEARTGNPPGPSEMIASSDDATMALVYASSVATERKDREVGIGHLLQALTWDTEVGPFLLYHGYTREKGRDALGQLRGRNRLRRRLNARPPLTQDLRNLLDRTALNNLVFSGGLGEVTFWNLLHAIITSNVDGEKAVPTVLVHEHFQGERVRTTIWKNEGQKILDLSGVDLEKLTQDVTDKVVDQYRPKTP